MPGRATSLLALSLALAAPGCCGLARIFCGAEDTGWAQISYRTPAETLATFLLAARKDDCRVIAESLSPGLKERWGGGAAEICVAWERLKEEAPVHMLGFAEVAEQPARPGRAAYLLEVSGYRFRVELVEQQFWAVHTRIEGLGELSRYQSMSSTTEWVDPDGRRLLQVTLPLGAYLQDMLLEDLDLDLADILEATVGREWKVDAFEQLPDGERP